MQTVCIKIVHIGVKNVFGYLLATADGHKLVLMIKVNHPKLSSTLLGFVEYLICIISTKQYRNTFNLYSLKLLFNDE